MTTIIDLTEEELAELREITKHDDPVDAVRFAMSEYIRYMKRQRLIER